MSAIPGPTPVPSQPMQTALRPAADAPEGAVSATRGGVQLLVAAVISIAANYLFLLGAGRILGSADYGTLAALSGLLTVVLIPTSAVQMAVSREVSRCEALGEQVEAAAFVRGLVVLGAKVTVPLLGVALVLLVPLRELLRVDATAPVALALTALVGVLLFPIALGALQGEQRFRALAFNSAAPMVIRLLVFAVLVAGGLHLYGAIGAVAVSSVAGTTIALLAIRRLLVSSRPVAVPDLRPFLRYLVPVAVGLFGIAVLTNVDIIVVKARFSAEDAGVYAAASAFARVAFFLPATILAVVFPRTAARQARGEQSADILGRSLIVTAGFCALLTGFYAVVGEPLVDLTFGTEFSGAAALLVPFCIAMTCFSLANVALGYHLSRGENRFAWVVTASIGVQILVLAIVPDSLRGVLWADAAVGVGLLAAHELTVGGSGSALRAGVRVFAPGKRLRLGVSTIVRRRALLVEAGLVLVGYSVLAALVTWPLALHLGSAMPGPFPSDGAGGAAWLGQLQGEDGYRLLGTTHHTLTGAPLGWDQGNALNFQWLVPYYPAYLVSGLVGEVAALNLVTLSGLVLSAASMYLLTRYLGCGRLASAWAGLVFMVFPWHLERALAGHASLVHLEVFPLVVLAAIAWVRRPTDGRAALVALVVGAGWLTSGYFGAMALIVLAGVTAVGFFVHRRSETTISSLRTTLKLWAMVFVVTGTTLVGSVLAGGSGSINIGRYAEELGLYGAHLHDYLPDPANPVLGGITDGVGTALIPYYPGVENVLYPGLLTVALALAWLVVVLRRRAVVPSWTRLVTLVLVVVAAIAVVCAAPDPMRLGGVQVKPMPSYVLMQILPSFRVPSRLIVVVMAALIPLAALGLSYLLGRVRSRLGGTRRAVVATTAIAAVACVVSVVELAPLPFDLSDLGTTPTAYAAVSRTPPGVVAEYPMTRAGTPANSEYGFWQLSHQRPLVNGAALNTEADAMRRMLVDPSAPGTSGALALLGVTSIVTRPTTFDWQEAALPGDPSSYGPGYALVDSSPAGVRVWRVTATPVPAIAAYGPADVAEPLPRDRNGVVWYPVTQADGRISVYAKEPRLLRLRFVARARQVEGTLRVGGRTGAVSQPLRRNGVLEVPVLVPAGHSVLGLTVRVPGGLRIRRNDVLLSAPTFARPRQGDRRIALVPTSISRDPGF